MYKRKEDQDQSIHTVQYKSRNFLSEGLYGTP